MRPKEQEVPQDIPAETSTRTIQTQGMGQDPRALGLMESTPAWAKVLMVSTGALPGAPWHRRILHFQTQSLRISLPHFLPFKPQVPSQGESCWLEQPPRSRWDHTALPDTSGSVRSHSDPTAKHPAQGGTVREQQPPQGPPGTAWALPHGFHAVPP